MIRLTKDEVQVACEGLLYSRFGTAMGYDEAIAEKLMDALELKNSLTEAVQAAATKVVQEDFPAQFSIPQLDSIYEQEIQRISTLQFNSKEICKFFYGKMRAHLMKEGQSGTSS